MYNNVSALVYIHKNDSIMILSEDRVRPVNHLGNFSICCYSSPNSEVSPRESRWLDNSCLLRWSLLVWFRFFKPLLTVCQKMWTVLCKTYWISPYRVFTKCSSGCTETAQNRSILCSDLAKLSCLQSAMLLLRYCYVPFLNYLARFVFPLLYENAAHSRWHHAICIYQHTSL